MRRSMPLALIAVVLAGCGGDAQRSREYRTVAEDPGRDVEAARAANAEAVRLVKEGDLGAAEEALKAALEADVLCGPAHNNLGLVHYRRGRLYLAAREFQYAARLMPHSAEPKNNLGLVLEAVGRLGEAEEAYDEALALEPDNPELSANLARVLVERGRKDERTREALEAVVLKDTRPDWVAWAREKLVMLGEPGEGVSSPGVAVAPPPR